MTSQVDKALEKCDKVLGSSYYAGIQRVGSIQMTANDVCRSSSSHMSGVCNTNDILDEIRAAVEQDMEEFSS